LRSGRLKLDRLSWWPAIGDYGTDGAGAQQTFDVGDKDAFA